jgi:2,5-diketo-D-gluconate reductase B
MAIAWLLNQEGVIVIPKAARPESQKANLDELGIQPDDDDRAAIAALPKDQRFVRPPFAPDWDADAGYRCSHVNQNCHSCVTCPV